MTSVDRDLQVVRLVAQFEAMTAAQVRGVLFAHNASLTASKRVLARLVAQRYLARYKWRLTTNRPGSAELVYQLGSNGWRFIGYEGAYKRLEAFDRHKLAIADWFVCLAALERAGHVELLDYITEPNNHERIGHIVLKPDLFARLRNMSDGGTYRYWYEIDLGTEHENQIKEKAKRYMRALDAVDRQNPKWRVFPQVVFAVRTVEGDVADTRRVDTLRRWLHEAGGELGLFVVGTFEELMNALRQGNVR